MSFRTVSQKIIFSTSISELDFAQDESWIIDLGSKYITGNSDLFTSLEPHIV